MNRFYASKSEMGLCLVIWKYSDTTIYWNERMIMNNLGDLIAFIHISRM